MDFDSAIKEHPLPWRVKLIGRDTPHGVCEIRDAKGRTVGASAMIGSGAAIYPQHVAKLIVWSVNSLGEVNQQVSDYNNGKFTHFTSDKLVDNITKILRGE